MLELLIVICILDCKFLFTLKTIAFAMHVSFLPPCTVKCLTVALKHFVCAIVVEESLASLPCHSIIAFLWQRAWTNSCLNIVIRRRQQVNASTKGSACESLPLKMNSYRLRVFYITYNDFTAHLPATIGYRRTEIFDAVANYVNNDTLSWLSSNFHK